MVDDPRFIAAIPELKEWLIKPLTLERPRNAQLHALLDDWRAGVLPRPTVLKGEPIQDFDAHVARLLDQPFQVFLIEHNWAAAFENAEDFKSDPARVIAREFDFRLPYEHCCFEFQLSGKRVCFLVHFDGENYRVAAFVRTRSGWLQPPLASPRFPDFAPLARFLDVQFRAVGVALEARVAETDVIRAPEKLNLARERRGKVPIFSYHVVRLANRTRVATPPDSDGDAARRSPRLHFRRGHWRHFENHKTWVKWTLVGDPDLGFIDKHYRL